MPDSFPTGRGVDVAVEEFTGPASYTAGGEPLRADIGDVTKAFANISGTTYVAETNGVQNGNEVLVTVFAVDGTGEAADATDLSGETITVLAVNA